MRYGTKKGPLLSSGQTQIDSLSEFEKKKNSTKVLKERKEDMNKMKKNILQLSIVFIAVLVFSTMTMAGGQKHHYRWWNPFSGLWTAINQLQDHVSKMEKNVDAKLEQLSTQGGGTPPASTIDPGSAPFVCPGCWFPEGKLCPNLDIDTSNLLKGAFLPGVEMYGTDLSGADLTKVDLRGSTLFDINFSGALLIGADFSPRPNKANGNSMENGTRITNADLTSADLTDADLSGATITGAIGLDSVIWDNTTCPDGKNSDDVGNTCINNL
jgi:hypothetical protein